MARFLVFGSVAWDRPIWLDKPLARGGRLFGFTAPDSASDLPGGRLGGAASNAAACLTNAGHEAAVWSAVPDDRIGGLIASRLANLGIDVSFLHPSQTVKGATIILIEPDGERTILFQTHEPDFDRTVRRHLKETAAEIDLASVETYQPDGILLRSLFSGYQKLAKLNGVCTVAHWPQSMTTSSLAADVLIGSWDDLAAADMLDDPMSQGRKACGARLKGMIITNGKVGGEIFTSERRIPYESPAVEQVDATGAGDAFASGVLEALTAGADLIEAAQHGAIWGGTSAGLRGSAESRPIATFSPWSSRAAVTT
ncbi:MAG: carbohydrate kinase family protein [Pseudomonadota bacterium]